MVADVLLVEDLEGFDRQFRDIFGEVDRFAKFGDLVASKKRGWSYAFVDFDLEDEATGFSVLDYLHEHSPGTKIVIYTALTENGRALFAMAARHWYNVWAVREKHGCTDDVLIAVRDEGRNPSIDRTNEILDRESWRIDTLFPQFDSVKLWSVWVEYGGSTRSIADAFKYFTRTQNDKFGTQVTAAILEMRIHIGALLGQRSTPVPAVGGKRTDNKVITTTFVQANSAFFHAGDLERVVSRVRPWESESNR